MNWKALLKSHSPARAVAVALVLGLSPLSGVAAEAPAGSAKPARVLADEPDKAWSQFQESAQPPRPPAEWNQKKPSQDEYEAFKKKMGVAAGAAADRAREFFERWPADARAGEAKDQYRKLLVAAVQLGATDRKAELEAIPGGGAAGPNVAAEARREGDSPDATGEDAEYLRRVRESIAKAQQLQSQGMEAMVLDYEKSLRALNKEFPDRPQYFAGLMEVSQLLSGDKALQITRELANSPKAPAQIREMAQSLLKSLERQGKPLDIKFKAVDGRDVDLAKLKGKVVLVDFWATWCGPCRVEIPNLRAAYEKLNPKGFEIVGISFDDDKEALVEFTKKNQMPWVQYFDGEGWGNKLGKEFGITGVPTMWLVDKKGVLRDLNGRMDLAGKVEKLLAEE